MAFSSLCAATKKHHSLLVAVVAVYMAAIKRKKPSKGIGSRACLITLIVVAGFYIYLNPIQEVQFSLLQDTVTLPTSTAAGEPPYAPGPAEQYIVDHIMNNSSLGWDSKKNPPGCMIWTDPTISIQPHLQQFLGELESYQQAVDEFSPIPNDIRTLKLEQGLGACDQLDLDLKARFPSQQLSHTGRSGFVEPLTTPMRHPKFCTKGREYLMDMKYMVHDFGYMCRHLHSRARTVLIDMGASLSYHDGQNNALLKTETTPIEYLLGLYQKFGFHFDHIYGYEKTFTDPEKVFSELLPPELHTSYHWINAGVNAKKNSSLNPLDTLVRKFSPDDFVVVKLDIDTAFLELPLAKQLLNDPEISSRVDQFYFEHHVHMQEMARIWRSGMDGTLQDTFSLFSDLRRAGVPAHFWV